MGRRIFVSPFRRSSQKSGVGFDFRRPRMPVKPAQAEGLRSGAGLARRPYCWGRQASGSPRWQTLSGRESGDWRDS